MSEIYDDDSYGIDVTEVATFGEGMSLADVIRHFEGELAGKTLTTHFAAGTGEVEDDVVTSVPIHAIRVGEDGIIGLVTEDAFGQPVAQQIDGDSGFIWSIYEGGDLWFQDKGDGRIWYGIYDTPLQPGYIEPGDL